MSPEWDTQAQYIAYTADRTAQLTRLDTEPCNTYFNREWPGKTEGGTAITIRGSLSPKEQQTCRHLALYYLRRELEEAPRFTVYEAERGGHNEGTA